VFPIFLLELFPDLNDINLRSCVLFFSYPVRSQATGLQLPTEFYSAWCSYSSLSHHPSLWPTYFIAAAVSVLFLRSVSRISSNASAESFVFLCSSHRRALVTRFVRPRLLRSSWLHLGRCSSSAASAWLISPCTSCFVLCAFGFLLPSFGRWVIMFAGLVLLSKNSWW
jgi:hypothetical protein